MNRYAAALDWLGQAFERAEVEMFTNEGAWPWLIAPQGANGPNRFVHARTPGVKIDPQ